jgi:thioesterase domain-containing protein/acyl carrier protein
LRLLQIWADLLGGRPVGIDDNFFDVGGHSLLALRLLVKIEQGLGVKLPLAALFEGPTIAQLAARVRGHAPGRSQIVPLWSAASGPALFLVHTGGGSVLNYVPLVRNLAPTVPVYGIQAQGLDGGGEPARSLPQLAAHYIDLMRTIAPRSPYLLAGHSLGGLIAYEMAQQLDASGEAVRLLALFDTRLAERNDAPADARVLAEAATAIGQFLGKRIPLAPGELQDLSPDALIARVLAELDRADALGFDGSADLVRNLLEVSRAHLAARRAYRPGPSSIPVTLFRARNGAADADAAYGWSALAPVRVVDAAGGHIEMLQEPHVRGLAVQFAACLNEALRA